MSNDTPSEYLPQDNWEGFSLQEPPADVEYAQWTEEVAVGQETYLPSKNRPRLLKVANEASDDEPRRNPRITDLEPFLSGDYIADIPSVGLSRADGLNLLYKSRWHTLIGATGCGKTWLGLLHVQAEMEKGNTIVYAHFEESTPHGTIARLRQLGITDAMILEQFKWIDASYSFRNGEFAELMLEIHNSSQESTLLVLDGINAACGYQQWNPEKIEAVGAYRTQFVTPATRLGMSVLSLGHPVKSRDRQGERHGFGSTGWLDEVDGASFRMEASSSAPIIRSKIGYANIHCVKDRYGEIVRHGELDKSREGWFSMGSLMVDDRGTLTEAMIELPRVAVPELNAAGEDADPIDDMCDMIVAYLNDGTGEFESKNKLTDGMRASKLNFTESKVSAALIRLEKMNVIYWPDARTKNGPRPGKLIRRGSDPANHPL